MQHSNKSNHYGDKSKSNRNNYQNDWEKEWKDQWIENAPDNEMINFAYNYSKEMVFNGLTTSQIRNFFSEVVRISQSDILKNKTEILMLKPKLAYASKRADKLGTKIFKLILTKALDIVINAPNDDEYKKRFKNFHALFEALLAYHKVHGGK